MSKSKKQHKPFYTHFWDINLPVVKPALIASFSFTLGFILSPHLLPIGLSSASTSTEIQTSADNTRTKSYSEKSITEKTTTLANSYIGASKNTAQINSKTKSSNPSTSAPSSTPSVPASGLHIPALGISSSVVASSLINNTPSVPAYGVSVYGTLYMGHSTGIFANLGYASTGQKLYLNGASYTISSVLLNQPIINNKTVGNYRMSKLVNLGANQIVLMTCAGYQAGLGWTGRTLVFATLD